MRFLLQRVLDGEVSVEETPGTFVVHGRIKRGLVVLVGFGADDSADLPSSRVWKGMIDKLLNLRVFSDADDKMNLSLADVNGEVLLVSQFTLYADCRRGRRPGFDTAAPQGAARALYDRLVCDLKERLGERLQCGVFGASMRVSLTNWGPVTILLDSREIFGL